MGRPTDIDRLYGLEQVFEPADHAGSDALELFADIHCPYCGETILIRLDLSAGDQSYVEDCQVCCQPILVGVQVGARGALDTLTAVRIDR